MKKIAIVAACTLVLAELAPGLFASGQGDGASGGVTKVRVAHMWQAGANKEADVALAILNKLDADHPEFEIVHEVVTGDEMRNKIRVDVAANNAPDLWQFWVGGVMADYAASGALLDINQYLAKSTRVKKANFTDDAWATVTFNGVTLGMPRNVSVGVFMVNKELFAKYNLQYPKTWADFIAVGKEFRKHGIIPTNIGSKGGNPSHFWFGDLACQYKDGVTQTEQIAKTLNFKNPAFIKAAKYCEEMQKAGLFPDDTMASGDWGPSIAFYNQGNVAMCYTFGWMFNDLPAEMVAKSEIIPIPRLPDGERDTKTFIQGAFNDSYVINAKSFQDQNKQAALVLIMDAICKDITPALAQMGVLVAADIEVNKAMDLNKIENKMMVKTLQYRIANNVSGSPMIWQNLPDNKLQFDYQAGLDELWAGALTADQCIDKIQKSFDDYKAKKK